MKSKFLCLAVCLILIMVSLAGCSNAPATPEGQPETQPETQPEGQPEETFVMRIAANLPQGSYEVDIHEEFKRCLEEKVGSRIKVEIYPAGQLGAPPAVIEGIQSGTIQSYLAPIAFLSGVAPGTQILDLPGFFETTEQAYDILNNTDAAKTLDEDMAKRGFTPLGYLVMDYRSIIAPFPVESLDDLKGKRFRVMTTPPQQLEFDAFGGSGVPVDPGETYTALQQGMVDGVCSGVHFFYSMKLHEVGKYYSNTRHAAFVSPLIVSTSWLDSLPDDLREVVVDTAKEVMPWGYEITKEYEGRALNAMIDEGLIVVEASPEFLEEIWEVSKVVHDKILADNPEWEQLYNDIKAEIEKR